jgi:hypothetical protein
MANAQQFKIDLRRFADKVELDMGTFRRRVTLDVKQKVERKTPVDQGTARASWAVSDGSPSSFVPAKGQAGIGPVEASFSKPFDISFVTSNLPYIIPLEFGSSKQAPQGMVRIALAEVETELEAAFGEL